MASSNYRWPTGKRHLSDDDVRTIRALVKSGKSKYSVARQFEVSWSLVQQAVMYRRRFAAIL